MRDAAGQLADRFHLLGLGELPFEPALLVLRAPLAARDEKARNRQRHEQRGRERQLIQHRSLNLAGDEVVLAADATIQVSSAASNLDHA